MELDLRVGNARARAQCLDDRDQRRGDLSRGHRPLLDPLPFEWLAQNEARAIQTEELSSRPVQPHDRPSCVNDEERVGHAREDGLQLQCMTLVLQGQLLRRAKTLDRDSRLRRDRG